MLALAYSAGELGRLTRVSLLLTVPIAVSVVLVNALTHAGTTVLVVLGPFDVTLEGVDFAGQIVFRLFAISASIGLFILTTDPRAFVFDLERRGAPPRVAFVAVATIDAIPTLVERAAVIGESQRAQESRWDLSPQPCSGRLRRCRSIGDRQEKSDSRTWSLTRLARRFI